MNEHESPDRLDDEHPLDPGIRAAFGGVRGSERRGSPSVLETVSGHRKVRRLLLREAEQASTAVVHPPAGGAADYPDQIDRYQVAGEIARGGVGVVLRARDLDLGREVALKILLDRHRGNHELNLRFLEEAQIGGQLEHPGIVPVYEIGLYDRDRPYLAMKYVRGQTLAELLESRDSPEEERQRFLGIFHQICQTLAYAHARGVIHRDLKPSNVMVGPFGEVQIMDWGLAKVLSKGGAADDARTTKRLDEKEPGTAPGQDAPAGSRSLAGSVMGTPAYMPPEQARGEVDSLDERCDVFGLGAILCEILTGKPPYSGASSNEIIEKARAADLAEALHPPGTSASDPEPLQLARSCLRAEASERPRNAIVVARKLQSYIQSLETRARSLEIRAGKAKLKLALAVVTIVGLIAGGTGYLLYDRQLQLSSAAVEAAELECEKLVAQARASQDLSTWKAAGREANRALELAAGLESSVIDRVKGLRDAIAEEVKGQQALAKLERLRQDRGWDPDEISRGIQEVFEEIGIAVDTTSVAGAAAIIQDSPIRASLVQALDQWMLNRRGPVTKKLFEIAQAADSDRWRSRVRSAVMNHDEAVLEDLAEEASGRALDPSTFELLASSLRHPWRHGRREAKNSERIERVWRQAQAVHPGDFWINAQLGRFLRYQGKAGEALQYTRIAVALRPDSGYARYQLGAALREAGATVEAMRQLRRSALLDPGFGAVYRKLSEILDDSPEGAREEVEDLLIDLDRLRSSGDALDPKGWFQLRAKAQSSLGDLAGAISTLEAAARAGVLERADRHRFGRRDSLVQELREYRRRLLPELSSYASIDTALTGELTGQGTGEVISSFRALHENKQTARLRLAYLEGRRLQEGGNFEEAASRSREVVAGDSTLPEPVLQLARCLRREGSVGEAEQTLRRGLAIETVRCPAVWELWVEIAFVDLDQTAGVILERFPAPASEPGSRNLSSYGEDLRWLLERLASGEPVLINCGGEAHRAVDGALWGRDRFFSPGSRTYFGGKVFFGEISGTGDDPLYQTERWYPRDAADPRGYRIPLPRGLYGVQLHFAEIFRARQRRENPRVFDVTIEERTVLERYSPGRRGFAAADRVELEVQVADGFLDLGFTPRAGEPKISAIFIEKRD